MYSKLPKQRKITRDRIVEMLDWSPRRFRVAEMDSVLDEPGPRSKDWNLHFPFWETFVPAFEAACDVNHMDFRSKPGQTFCYTFLWDVDEAQIRSVRRWLAAIENAVAIRDLLALSFALDYECECGDPGRPQTEIGALRYRAKPYRRQVTGALRAAAQDLGDRCVAFLESVTCFNGADAVVAVPPSDPDTDFSLPAVVAGVIADKWELRNLCEEVFTTQRREQLKNLPISEKLSALKDTIGVGDGVRGKNILLIDDLYQSGVTMNFVAMELLEAGAMAVYGLSCEKTCRNDANVPGEDA